MPWWTFLTKLPLNWDNWTRLWVSLCCMGQVRALGTTTRVVTIWMQPNFKEQPKLRLLTRSTSKTSHASLASKPAWYYRPHRRSFLTVKRQAMPNIIHNRLLFPKMYQISNIYRRRTRWIPSKDSKFLPNSKTFSRSSKKKHRVQFLRVSFSKGRLGIRACRIQKWFALIRG